MGIKIYVYLLIFCLSALAFEFPANFEFGVSNASSQVEDKLDDPWMKFAKSGKSKAFLNTPVAAKKIEFWTKPEIEIKLAKELGVKVFRMSLSWKRIMPKPGVINEVALNRYLEILKMIKASDMKVMLSLFHHSIPDWAIELGGWPNSQLIKYFEQWALRSIDLLNSHVDYWITFNEPNVYAMFSYVAGMWPPGEKNTLGVLNLPFYKGAFFEALDNMAIAHNQSYKAMKEKYPKSIIGIAHNTANYKSTGLLSTFSKNWSWENMNYRFPDQTKNALDFMGFNYYGSEYMTISGIEFNKEAQYNDAGRAIDPNGLYDMIKIFYKRYKLPIFITENGTADTEDFFRGAYLIEHLLAIHKALQEKIPILGYIHWSLTDNFEWSDGYCPQFGLVAVDRENGLKRLPRVSYYLYKEIIKTSRISKEQRKNEWKKVSDRFGSMRKMCRAANGQDALDKPRKIKFSEINWQTDYTEK